ncbi:hypothetical protein CVT24_003184 [Panaeolus cyanescens]|uniref:Uncharacterized protein n=1 Tax=Panaeolus cyanescens TaxID=181874 RepID=A0A409VUB2_9AGAR|nr:hypothetical protein CVT24_003184 [Panaeolus cyanescens]
MPLSESQNVGSLKLVDRGPIILTIDEAEYLIDQLPPPSPDDDELVKKLRKRLQDLLADLRKGAEGVTQQ